MIKMIIHFIVCYFVSEMVSKNFTGGRFFFSVSEYIIFGLRK